jgi:transcriptional regulator of nitric oxide reductase/ferredoxin
MPVFAASAIEQHLDKAFPGADGFGAQTDDPKVYPAYKDGVIVGYAFLSADVIDSAGFSGKPLNVAIGLDLQGRITGARLVEHHEPILIIGVKDQDLEAFVAQYRGVDVRDTVRLASFAEAGAQTVDGITGATISSLSLNDVILGASRAVARGLGIVGGTGGVFDTVDVDTFAPQDWAALRADDSIAQLTLTNGTVVDTFRRLGIEDLPGLTGNPGANFITLYATLVNPALIGRNLLGDEPYARLTAERGLGDTLLFFAAQGIYSFKGTGYVRSGTFDRVQIVQGARTYRLTKDQHRRVDELAIADPPPLREKALFVLPEGSGFDPAAPWRLELLVARENGERGQVLASFVLPYRLPARHLRKEAAAERDLLDGRPSLWMTAWRGKAGRIAVLCLALLALTSVLVFEDFIAQRARLYGRLRVGALIFTLLWLGWYANAQLSVVNVITFANALLTGFSWDFFLLDPVLFILWGYVAMALLFWGRGVFCGWLCPFGALHELINRVARFFRVPQVPIPFALNERLWPIKYIVFLALFALSLGSMQLTVWGAEVEPFKTAIVMKFAREWYWVAFAVVILGVGVFIERFYCRYLCPLGAALAIPARLRMFQWVKRRYQCGTQCQICAVQCPVQAIHPTGEINPNECIHCLKCQTFYYDDHNCPPLVARRKRLERLSSPHLAEDAIEKVKP